jgi:mycofactocin precursor
MNTAANTANTDVAEQAEAHADRPLTAESLIEEVSIDGMCGVY